MKRGTLAELEKAAEAAHQLRAETLGGVRWIVAPCVNAARLIFRSFRGTRIIRSPR
jgi:hypothetical protein